MKRLFAKLLTVTMLLMVFGAPVLTGAAITETIEYKSITLTSGDSPNVGDNITLYGQDFKTGGVVTSIGIIPEGQAIDGSKEMFSKLKLFYSHTGNDGKSAPDPNATINSSGNFEINAKLTVSYGTQITPGTYKVFLWWLPDPNGTTENIAISNETFTVYGAEVTSSATYKAPTATPTAAPTPTPITTTNEVSVKINGNAVAFDVPPQIIENRTMVPLRKIFEVLGAQVNWEGETRTITGIKGETTVVLQVGNTKAFINGVEKTLDVPPLIINGRTLVPARFISESLGAVVGWDGTTRTVTINMAE